MRRLLLALALGLALAPPAVAADPEIEDGSAQAALDAARANWASEGFGGDYDWWVSPGPFEVVKVRGGAGEFTVPALFDRIQQAIDDRVDEFRAIYGDRGVPLSVRADGYQASVGGIRAAGVGDAVRAALADARARWGQTNLADYDITVRLGCFCPPAATAPKVFHVRDGRAFEPDATDVGKLFAFIEANADAYRLEVEYAPDGHPISVYVDRHPDIVDEETSYTVEDLRPATYDPAAQAALDAARARWEANRLTDYGYRVRTLCFCPNQITRPYAVHVRDGRPVRSHRYIRSVDTVEELFAHIQSAISGNAFALRAIYGERGVPRSISLNPSEYVFDEETSYVISPIRPEPGTLPKRVALSILDGTARVQLRLAQERWIEAGRPRRRHTQKAYRRIRKAIRKRARVLQVRYGKRGVPIRIVTRP